MVDKQSGGGGLQFVAVIYLLLLINLFAYPLPHSSPFDGRVFEQLTIDFDKILTLLFSLQRAIKKPGVFGQGKENCVSKPTYFLTNVKHFSSIAQVFDNSAEIVPWVNRNGPTYLITLLTDVVPTKFGTDIQTMAIRHTHIPQTPQIEPFLWCFHQFLDPSLFHIFFRAHTRGSKYHSS